MTETNPILLFDGLCNLCNGVVKFIIKRDPNAFFRFSSLQSEKGQELLKKYNLAGRNLDTFVYLKEGKYYLKSTAALMLFRDIGGVWKLLYVLIIIPAPIRDFFYSIVSKTRYMIFGKKDSCMVPTTDILDRFLD